MRPFLRVSNRARRFVYVIRSTQNLQKHYVGLSGNPTRRLAAHNAGLSPHTSKYRPRRLLVSIEFADPARAALFERYLKSGSGRAFAKRHFR